MNLKQLERFVVVAEHGNIAAAADRLGLSQPALTRSIQLLEEALGSPLFERLSRGVTLTALGVKILPYARLMVRERAQLRAAIDEFNGVRGGSLAFGATDNLLDGSASAVVLFQKNHPSITIDVCSGPIAELFAGLHDGSLDLVLATLGSHAVPATLCFEPIFETKTSIVARRQHPLGSRERVSFQDLAQARWLIIGGNAAQDGLKRTFERHGARPPEHAIRCDSLSFVKNCLLVDDYVAMLDQRYIAAELDGGVLRILTTDTAAISLASGLVYRQDIPRSRVRDTFMQAIRQGARRP